jgi:N-acetylmuramoyl-L-alanine amidase
MMNFKIAYFALLAFFFLSLDAPAYVVILDPGHGGVDSGASRGSFVESAIVYQIAERIQEHLKKNPEIEVYLTRGPNHGKSLHERVDYAQLKKADLFLSLHANSSPSTQVTGMEYYFNARNNSSVLLKNTSAAMVSTKSESIVEAIKKDLAEFGKTKRSLELSQNIQSVWALSEFGKEQTTTSKIRRAPFYVIENTSMPSVLVEVGFISNQREARKLVSSSYQEYLASALSEAIVNFKEKSDK